MRYKIYSFESNELIRGKLLAQGLHATTLGIFIYIVSFHSYKLH